MNKLKICFIAQFPPPIHGLSKAVETLYNSNIKEDFELEKVDITNNKRFLKNLFSILKSKADLFYFTISQTKGGNIRDLIIFKLLELKNKKCLIHLHGGYYRKLVDNNMSSLQRKMNYKAISKLAGAIVLGESLKNIFHGMIDENKIIVVPNCVDDEFLMSDEEFLEKIAIQKEKKIKHVLYLSNFIKDKGYPYVLEMAKLEKERCDRGEERKLHFDFAGKFFDKKEEDYFFYYITDNNLEDYVTYHGVVSGNEKNELLKMCDVFVLLTRYANEGQPISILEAMGNGMFIISTKHAGIPDIVQNDYNGWLLSEVNCSDILDKLNSVDLCEFAVRNRNIVSEQYKENIYINNMKHCFKTI